MCQLSTAMAGWLAGWWSLASVTTGPRARWRGGSINYLLHVLALGTPPSSWLAAWQLAGWLGGTSRLTPPQTWQNQPEPNAPGQAEPRPAATWLLPCFTRTKPAPSWLLASRLAGGPAGGDPKEAPECLRDGGSRHATSKILGRKSRWHSCLLSGNIETGRPGASYINFN